MARPAKKMIEVPEKEYKVLLEKIENLELDKLCGEKLKRGKFISEKEFLERAKKRGLI